MFQAGRPVFRKYDAKGTLLFERQIQGREIDDLLPTVGHGVTQGAALADVERCLRAGCNVVTTALYPFYDPTGAPPDLRARVHAASPERMALAADWARRLKPLPPSERIDANRVRGCVSPVWLVGELLDGRCFFRAEAESPTSLGQAAE